MFPAHVRRSILLGLTLLAVAAGTGRLAAAEPGPSRVDRYGDPLPPGARLRLGTTRFRIDDTAYSLDLSPDGKVVAVATRGGQVYLFDAITGRTLRCLQADPGGPNYLTFSPDGKLLATVGHNGILRLYGVARGRLLARFGSAGPGEAGPVVFSANGKVLAKGSEGFGQKLSVAVWEVATRKELRRISVVPDREVKVALSPDGTVLASWGQQMGGRSDVGRTVQLWDLMTGRELRRLRIKGGLVQATAFAPDGKNLAVAENGTRVSIWDLTTGKQLRRFAVHRDTGTSLRYSPDGKILAGGTSDGVIQLWDTFTGKRLAVVRGPGRPPSALVFGAGNQTWAAGTVDQMVCVWQVSAGTAGGPWVGHGGVVTTVGFSPDGQVVFSGSADGLRCWDAGTGRELRYLTVRNEEDSPARSTPWSRPIPLALSPDGKYLACKASPHRGVCVVDVATGEELFSVDEYHLGPDAAFSAAGTFPALAVLRGAPGGEATVGLWDPATGQELRRLQVKGGDDFALAFSSTGRRVAVARTRHLPGPGLGPQFQVRVWETATGKKVCDLASTGWVQKLAFSPDGELLATAEQEQTVCWLWDAASGRGLGHFERREELLPPLVISPLVFSPDGRTLAVAMGPPQGGDSQVLLWEVASRKVRCAFTGHRGSVAALAFAPDGRCLATGGADTTVLLWDLFGGKNPVPVRLSDRELEDLWSDLASSDAQKAYRALTRLGAAPEQAVALVGKQIGPVRRKSLHPKEIERLVADLDADTFAIREKASHALEQVGKPARAAVVRALASGPAPEKRRRLEALLERLSRVDPAPEELRPLRAVEVLEWIGTAEARKLLEEIAGGDPDARLTREASRSLQRLGRHPRPAPSRGD